MHGNGNDIATTNKYCYNNKTNKNTTTNKLSL